MITEEVRRFKCPRFKITLEITYRYKDNQVIEISCPICKRISPSPYGKRRCSGFYSDGTQCIIFLPYPHLNTFLHP